MFNLVIHSGTTHLKWNSLFYVIVNGSICNGNSAKRNAHFIKWHCCHYHKVKISLNICDFNWKKAHGHRGALEEAFSIAAKIVFLFLRNRKKTQSKLQTTKHLVEMQIAQHNTCCNIINVRKTVKKPKHAMKANTYIKQNLNVYVAKTFVRIITCQAHFFLFSFFWCWFMFVFLIICTK